jgi:hypothetical protein
MLLSALRQQHQVLQDAVWRVNAINSQPGACRHSHSPFAVLCCAVVGPLLPSTLSCISETTAAWRVGQGTSAALRLMGLPGRSANVAARVMHDPMQTKQGPLACRRSHRPNGRPLMVQQSNWKPWRRPTRPRAPHQPSHAPGMETVRLGHQGQPGAQQHTTPPEGAQIHSTRPQRCHHACMPCQRAA